MTPLSHEWERGGGEGTLITPLPSPLPQAGEGTYVFLSGQGNKA
ncbi:MAG: hypothetical protein PHU06_05290 [Gallionella sp.]|nr:hypothetical protein [Gallionella sp.]MDD4959724.1 hypothetical protein [Gallionella sp.]